jgi:hypothetical protein
MAIKKTNPIQSAKSTKALEDIYLEFEQKLIALKKEKDLAVSQIMRQIDDQKIKKILSQIK